MIKIFWAEYFDFAIILKRIRMLCEIIHLFHKLAANLKFGEAVVDLLGACIEIKRQLYTTLEFLKYLIFLALRGVDSHSKEANYSRRD